MNPTTTPAPTDPTALLDALAAAKRAAQPNLDAANEGQRILEIARQEIARRRWRALTPAAVKEGLERQAGTRVGPSNRAERRRAMKLMMRRPKDPDHYERLLAAYRDAPGSPYRTAARTLESVKAAA